MGCDIHLHTEVKVDGVWHSYGQPRLERSYRLFEKMAGVRGLVENAISPPKGLPDDISVVVRLHVDDCEGSSHSHSWLGPEEIKELSVWLRETNVHWPYNDLEHGWIGYLFSNSWHRFPDVFEDVRLVFWFDN